MKRTNENGWYAVTERWVMQLYDNEDCSVCPISEEDLLCFWFTKQKDWIEECAEEVVEKLNNNAIRCSGDAMNLAYKIIRKHLPTNKYNE